MKARLVNYEKSTEPVLHHYIETHGKQTVAEFSGTESKVIYKDVEKALREMLC